MLDVLKNILKIQDLDMKMIRLMRLKKERQKELHNLRKIKLDLVEKCQEKKEEIVHLKHQVHLADADVEAVKEKIKRYEQQQSQIKKVEEFNALSQEMSQAERERVQKEQKASDLLDAVSDQEDILKSLEETVAQTDESSTDLEKEIITGIENINEEGRALKQERLALVELADPEVLAIYDRLMYNKKDRVVVPIENRTCSGCHILVTAQDENLVRKGERLVFCEHCSRIQYWPQVETLLEGEEALKPTRRRRRAKTS